MTINFSNIEEIIFSNKEIVEELHEFSHIFYQWKISKISNSLKKISDECKLFILNNLKEDHVKRIEVILGTNIIIKKIDNNIIKNYKFNIHSIEKKMNELCKNGEIDGYKDFYMYRDKDSIEVSFWR